MQDGTGGTDATARWGAYALLGAAAFMALGGIIKRRVGADLDAALASGDMTSYFSIAAEHQTLLSVNLSAWIAGVLLFGVAGTALARLCVRRRTLAQVALVSYWTGVPLAIGSFVAWLALIVQLPAQMRFPHHLIAEVVGWWVSRTDWIATVLLVGLGPLLLSVAGRDEWAPAWLVWWGLAAAIAGLVTLVAMVAGGLSTYGQLIIPVGLGWSIAAGIVLLRRAGSSSARSR